MKYVKTVNGWLDENGELVDDFYSDYLDSSLAECQKYPDFYKVKDNNTTFTSIDLK